MPSWFIKSLFVTGAILVIGCLSFSGMYVLWPILPVALIALIFSVMYEGHIYIENITSAWNKLFEPDYLKETHAKQVLHELMLASLPLENCPIFFKDYEKQLKLWALFEDKTLSAQALEKKEKIERTLKAMESWFTRQLFQDKVYVSSDEAYQREVQTWLQGRLESVETPATCKFHDISPKLVFDPSKSKARKTAVGGCGEQCKSGLFWNSATQELKYVNQNKETTVFTVTNEMAQQIANIKAKEQLKMDDLQLLLPFEIIATFFPSTTTKQHQSVTAGQLSIQSEQQALFERRRRWFRPLQALSFLAGLCMGVGTTYLLIEAFSVISVFSLLSVSLWPVLIVPFAIVSGIAYGFLTYNAFINMTMDNTFLTWVDTVKADWRQGFPKATLYRALGIAILMALSIILTVCTAGTWWTVVRYSQPLFRWMCQIPLLVFEILIPTIIGGTTLVFNISNVFDTIAFLDKNLSKIWQEFKELPQVLLEVFTQTVKQEHLLQWINPFRWLINLVEKPLRILFFLIHLVGIAVSSDRFPGIPEILSALIGILCEGAEDLHYFVKKTPHTCEETAELLEERLGSEAHSHEDDLPSTILKYTFLWAHYAAAIWDKYASCLNVGVEGKEVLDWTKAYKKYGMASVEEVTLPAESEKYPSHGWTAEDVHQCLISEQQRLQQAQCALALRDVKVAALSQLDQSLCQELKESVKDCSSVLSSHINQYQSTYQTQRLTPAAWIPHFFVEPTLTEECVEEIKDIIAPAC